MRFRIFIRLNLFALNAYAIIRLYERPEVTISNAQKANIMKHDCELIYLIYSYDKTITNWTPQREYWEHPSIYMIKIMIKQLFSRFTCDLPNVTIFLPNSLRLTFLDFFARRSATMFSAISCHLEAPEVAGKSFNK